MNSLAVAVTCSNKREYSSSFLINLLDTIYVRNKYFFNDCDIKIHIFPSEVAFQIDKPIFNFSIHFPKADCNLFQNSVRALNYCALRYDWVLFFQDDVIVCKNMIPFVFKLLPQLPNDLGALTFFNTQSEESAKCNNIKICQLPARYFWGFQSILIRTETIRCYFESSTFLNNKFFSKNPDRHIDLSFGHFIKNYYLFDIYFSLPSLVQHIGGNNSTIENCGERRSRVFSELYDPMKHIDAIEFVQKKEKQILKKFLG